jgi:hypothetical protein
MATLGTSRVCPYCAAQIELGDCPVVATSFVGVEFRDPESFDIGEVELYSGRQPRRLLDKTAWPVLAEPPRQMLTNMVSRRQRERSGLEQAFASFSSPSTATAPLPSLAAEGLAREDVPARACHACEFPLPVTIDERPAVVVAVVGVNRVGKTHMLATSLTEAYRRQGLAAIGCTEFVPDDSTGKLFLEEYYNRLFRQGQILERTQAEDEDRRFQPLVFNVTIAGRVPFSLVLHDIAGEVLGDQQKRARAATYLHGARGMVFLVDPRDVDDLRSGITARMPEEEEDLGWDQGTLLSTCLRPDGLLDHASPIPVAVAIAKADLLPAAAGESLPFLERAPARESEREFYERVRSYSGAVREFLERHDAYNILAPAGEYEKRLHAAGDEAGLTYHAFSALGCPPGAGSVVGGKVEPINCLDPLAAVLAQIWPE